MAPKDLDKLIAKYLEGKGTKEEIELIDSLYASLGREGAHRRDMAVTEERLTSVRENMNKELAAYVCQRAEAGQEEAPRRAWVRYTGIAAALVLCLMAVYYFQPSSSPASVAAEHHPGMPLHVIENTAKVNKRVILPDGSIVEMSPESSVRFSDDAGKISRELYLEGEAYFDVAHNSERPFYVYAGDVVTRVLGTTFIVRARGRDETVTVSVKTGKVTVYSRNSEHKKTVLVPNQEAVYDRTTDIVATQTVSLSEAAVRPVRLAEMHFEETPVPEVLTMLKHTYDIDIVFGEEVLSGCVLTSSFYEEGLYDRIDVICTAIGATYKVVDSQIVIESQGCNLKTQ